MNKIVKNIIIFTVISVSAIIVKSDSKIETEKEIIYNYYDIDDDISSIKVDSILEKIDKEYDIDTFAFGSKEDISSVLLLNAVIDNDKLTTEEKELCYELLPFYLDYDSLDKKGIYERLNTLDIEYSKEEFKAGTNEIKGATYYRNCNTVVCYQKKDAILHHELFHVLLPMKNFPLAIKEGLVSRLTIEYFPNEEINISSTYIRYTSLVNTLTYLIDSDTLIELASLSDLKELKEQLISKGSITKGELDNLLLQLDNNMDINTRTKVATTLLVNYPWLKEEEKALYNLEAFNIYTNNSDNTSYFIKTKTK